MPPSGCRWGSPISGCGRSSSSRWRFTSARKGSDASLHHYKPDLVIHSLTRYTLAPARVDRLGAVPIAALVLTPLAFFARRRRWAALVLGGTVVILVLDLSPLVFPHFSNIVSLSQSRRAAVFIPYALALAGGAAVIAGVSRLLALALALAGGIWLQLSYPGDFGLTAAAHQPSLPVWIGLYGGIAAIVIGTVAAWLRRDPFPRVVGGHGTTVALAALLFVLPVSVHGFRTWNASYTMDHSRAHAGADPVPAAGRACALGRLRRSRDELPRRRVRAGLRRDRAADARGKHEAESTLRAQARVAEVPRASESRGASRLARGLDRPTPRRARSSGARSSALGKRPVYADNGFLVFRLPLPLQP